MWCVGTLVVAVGSLGVTVGSLVVAVGSLVVAVGMGRELHSQSVPPFVFRNLFKVAQPDISTASWGTHCFACQLTRWPPARAPSARGLGSTPWSGN